MSFNVGCCQVHHFECRNLISTLGWTWFWPMWIQQAAKMIILRRTRQHPLGSRILARRRRLQLLMTALDQIFPFFVMFNYDVNFRVMFWRWWVGWLVAFLALQFAIYLWRLRVSSFVYIVYKIFERLLWESLMGTTLRLSVRLPYRTRPCFFSFSSFPLYSHSRSIPVFLKELFACGNILFLFSQNLHLRRRLCMIMPLWMW